MQNIELIPLPTRKDDRGWVISLPTIQNLGQANLHIPSLKPKAVRGNHYHEHHTEAVIILGGKCLVATRNRLSGISEEFIYDGINKLLLLIPPNITHAFKNISYRSIYLVCYCYRTKGEDIPVSSISDQILT
ncbi:MAG: WxcM-like domain-containing protein [bacterium]|nr:WxcM-like domain-containing protein [bacterium]